MLKTNVLLHILVEIVIFDERKVQNNNVFEILIFCNILNVFFTYDKFNAFLTNKNVNFYVFFFF